VSASIMLYWDPQWYVESRTYHGLKREWFGFKIAKKDGDLDKMKYYAEGIQKFEKQLRLPVPNFLDILEIDLDSQTTKYKEGSTATYEL
jgi:hypothetical protein